MTRSSVICLIPLLLCAACATGRSATPEAEQLYMRLLDVEPAVGTRVTPETTIRVRAAYRLPPGTESYQADLMFLSGTGSLVSAIGVRPVQLVEREGVVELSAVPGAARGTLAQPLTALVMVMTSPRDPAHAGVPADPNDLPPAVQARIQQMRDSAGGGRDSVLVQVRAAVATPVMRSRAIFYNGAGPAQGGLGPDLPFDEVLAEYLTYGGHKALAVAVDERGRRTWGSAFGYSAADSAVARALQECERSSVRRELQATCQVPCCRRQPSALSQQGDRSGPGSSPYYRHALIQSGSRGLYPPAYSKRGGRFGIAYLNGCQRAYTVCSTLNRAANQRRFPAPILSHIPSAQPVNDATPTTARSVPQGWASDGRC